MQAAAIHAEPMSRGSAGSPEVRGITASLMSHLDDDVSVVVRQFLSHVLDPERIFTSLGLPPSTSPPSAPPSSSTSTASSSFLFLPPTLLASSSSSPPTLLASSSSSPWHPWSAPSNEVAPPSVPRAPASPLGVPEVHPSAQRYLPPHSVEGSIRREMHSSLTTLFYLRRADVPDLSSLNSSAMSSTRKELVRLGLRDATAALSPAERKVVVYLYLEQKAERYDTVTERVEVSEGSIAADIATLEITSFSSSGQPSVQVYRSSCNSSHDRPTRVRRSYYGRASAFGRLASSVAAFRAHYGGLWPVTYVTRVLTLLWGVAYQPSGHLFYDHPAALMGATPFSCLATEQLRAAARALASQPRSPSPPLPATSLPAAVELPTLRELFFDSELPGVWCCLRNAVLLAQFELHSAALFEDFCLFFGGIDGIIWRLRQGGIASYNRSGSCRYNVNYHFLHLYRTILHGLLPMGTDQPSLEVAHICKRCGLATDDHLTSTLPARYPLSSVLTRPHYRRFIPPSIFRWASFGVDRHGRGYEVKRLHTLAHFIFAATGPLSLAVYRPTILHDDISVAMRGILGLCPLTYPDHSSVPLAHKRCLVWRLLVDRWCEYICTEFSARMGLRTDELRREHRVLAGRGNPAYDPPAAAAADSPFSYFPDPAIFDVPDITPTRRPLVLTGTVMRVPGTTVEQPMLVCKDYRYFEPPHEFELQVYQSDDEDGIEIEGASDDEDGIEIEDASPSYSPMPSPAASDDED